MWSSLRHSKKRVYWKTRITCSVYWSHVTEHRCNCCNCPFFKIWLNYKTRTLSRLFSQPLYKTHLLALLCHFTDQNDKIPYLSYTYTHYPSYTWILEMVKSKARRKVYFKLVYKIYYLIQLFSYDFEVKTREQNRNNKRSKIERFDSLVERIQTRVRFDWLSKRLAEKLSRNQSILRFDVIPQHD